VKLVQGTIAVVESLRSPYYSDMRYLPILGLTVALVCYADLAVAKTPAEIQSIAKAVTVEITLLKDDSVGSGIIIDRKGDLYTLVTNRHVVCGQIRKCTAPPEGETYTMKLGNGQKYQVSAKSVKLLGNDLDLAIIQFRSNIAYRVAKVAAPNRLKAGDRVYTSGYPLTPPGFSFNSGNAIAVVNKRLIEDQGGYTIVYDAETQPGMSGGGVFDENGLLVAIHGQGYRYQNNTQDIESRFTGQLEVGSKIGYNRGLSVRWVLQGIAIYGRNSNSIRYQQAPHKADEYFIMGFNKWIDPGSDKQAGRQEAIREFSQAIRLNPRYTIAYIMRASVSEQIKQYSQALDDFNKALLLDPQNAYIYYMRGRLKHLRLDDQTGALTDFKKAVYIDHRYTSGWYSRGFRHIYLAQDLFHEENRIYSSLEECNAAITSNPQDSQAYLDRGILEYTKLKDQPRAIADIHLAVKIARAQANSSAVEIALKALKLMGSSE
jgi:tetratricopeptide (TPR) repeat protein